MASRGIRRVPVRLLRGAARLRPPSAAGLLGPLRRRIPQGPVVPAAPAEVAQLPPAGPEPVVRTRWPHILTVTLGAAGFVVTIAGLRAVNEIAGPVFLALNLVIAGYPMNLWLRRKGVPGVVAAALTGLVVVSLLIAFFALLGWAIASLVLEMPRYVPKVEQLYVDLLAMLETQGITEQQILANIQQTTTEQWQSVAQQGLTVLQGILANVSGVLSLLVVLITVLFFLMMDTIGIGTRLDLIREANPRAAAVLRDFGRGVRRYWIVTTVFGLIVAVLDTWVLMYIGVPLALVWGIFSFLTNYIPNIGFVIGLVPPALLALLERGPGAALAVVIAYSLLNFVIQSLIQPKVAGDAVGVTPTVSVVSLLFWTWVLGPLGALLALPATLLVKAVLIDGDTHAGWVSYLITSSPAGQREPGDFDDPAVEGRDVASRTSPTSASSTSSSATTPPPSTPST